MAYLLTFKSNLLDNHHGRIRIGYKVVPDGESGNMLIVAGLISGYNDGGYEWISNFDLGDGSIKTHKGFYEASDEIISFIDETTKKIQLLNQVKERNIKKTKYWLMGHSRGGAITAIVSHKLHEKYGVEQKNIYGFGFATPRMISGKEKTDLEKETNIKNYLIPEDFVTHVAPENWGYERFGQDVFLDQNVSRRNRIFYLSTGEEYTGFIQNETKTLIEAFEALGEDPYRYATVPRVDLTGTSLITNNATAKFYAMYGLGAACAKPLPVIAMGVSVLRRTSQVNPFAAKVTGLMIYDGKITDKFEHAHCMGAYVAAMLAQYGS